MDESDLKVLEQFTTEAPVKVGALADALGLRVVVATLPMNISGLIKPDEERPGKFVIKVNRFESKERQRFTIAHEIAHFLLHRDLIQSGVVDSVLYRSKLSSRAESEANKLAADIIMPSRLVYPASRELNFESDDQKVAYLAQKFDVSRQAMSIRTG